MSEEVEKTGPVALTDDDLHHATGGFLQPLSGSWLGLLSDMQDLQQQLQAGTAPTDTKETTSSEELQNLQDQMDKYDEAIDTAATTTQQFSNQTSTIISNLR